VDKTISISQKTKTKQTTKKRKKKEMAKESRYFSYLKLDSSAVTSCTKTRRKMWRSCKMSPFPPKKSGVSL